MQKILVAGGAGFIGSNLCRRLLSENYQVVCVDNFVSGQKKNIEPFLSDDRFALIEHDVIKPLPSDTPVVDAIFHLASPASPNHHSSLSYLAHPMETMMANTIGTKHLLEFAKKHAAKFLFASTSEVYGDPLEHPQKEEYRGNVSTTGPRSVYDEAKRFGETLTAFFWRSENLDARIARIHNTYGPGMNASDMRMIVLFISQALAQKPITIYGDGDQTRSLCFVDDMIDGLLRLMFAPNTKGEVVNLGTTFEHSVMEYARMIKKLTGSRSEIVMSEALPEDDPRRRRPDISKAERLLSWKPVTPLEEGLRRTIEYFKHA